MTLKISSTEKTKTKPKTTKEGDSLNPPATQLSQEENSSEKKIQTVAIAEILRSSGWTDQQNRWQNWVLGAADAVAGPGDATEPRLVRRDKKTSVAEVRKYIENPKAVQITRTLDGRKVKSQVLFLSSERVLDIMRELDAVNGDVSKLPAQPSWLKPAVNLMLEDLGKQGQTSVSAAEVKTFAQNFHAGKIGATGKIVLITQQRLSQLYHRVAEQTNERDALDVIDSMSEYSLQFNAMNVLWDNDTKTFSTVRTTLFEADLRLQTNNRPEDFKSHFPQLSAEPETYEGPLKLKKLGEKNAEGFELFSVTDSKGQPVAGVDLAKVFGPGLREGRSYFPLQRENGEWVRNAAGHIQLATFDKGHAQANLQFARLDDQKSSFAMENMHAQVPSSNSNVWLNEVEEVVREELKKHPNSRAVDLTGALFAKTSPRADVTVKPWALDSRDDDVTQFKPLPNEERIWIAGKDNSETERVPVPSHSYKAVLFQQQGPPQTYYCRCFIVKNDMNLDSRSKPLEVTLAQLEKILSDSGSAQTFFEDLPPHIAYGIRQGQTVKADDSFITVAPRLNGQSAE